MWFLKALRALRAAQELSETEEEGDGDAVGEEDHMKFRNYVPQDKELQDGKVTPPELPKFEDPVAALPPADPFVNIAQKKPNWDLRRDVQKKLDKLERRTQKAMVVRSMRKNVRRQKLMKRQQKVKRPDDDMKEAAEHYYSIFVQLAIKLLSEER
ncbi:hypothetical protein Bca4012_066980 [Brassica carinata]